MYEHRDDIPTSPPDTDGEVARRRLRWGLLAAVAVTLVAAVPGIALNSGGDTKKVTSAQGFTAATTTTTVGIGVVAGVPMPPTPAPTTTAPASGPALQTGTTKPPAATTTTAARPAPPPPKVCRDSVDPACGPFRWDPDPGPNAPLTVTVSPPSQQVTAAQEVNFHIVAHDPDAKVDRCYTFDFGDGQKGSTCPPPPSCQTAYGPWTPPAKADDTYTLDVKHTYSTASPPGQPYVASFVLQSHSFCDPDPYGGAGQGSAQVTVSA